MSKYIIEFKKTGTICYTSHLDLMRIFKRAFKRSGIALGYSQGFNPHPKMGFAQPLSLGYWGMEEYIEFETAQEWEPDQLLQRLDRGLPEGIDLTRCLSADHLTKTLAAHTRAAQYMIEVPVETGSGQMKREEEAAPAPGDTAVETDPHVDQKDPRALWHSLMDLDQIPVWKRQKKKKEPKLIDIKPMIREITFSPSPAGYSEEQDQWVLFIDVLLDCGSDSNLSPELVISSALKRFGIETDRSRISVMRKKLVFDRPLEELL